MRSIIKRTSSSSCSGHTRPSMYLHFGWTCQQLPLISDIFFLIYKQNCGPMVIISQSRLQLTRTRGPQQSQHDCHMHCERGEAGVMIGGLLTSACPTAGHTHPPCAARSSGTIAPWAAPTTTRCFMTTLTEEKACPDNTYASDGGMHEATALQRK